MLLIVVHHIYQFTASRYGVIYPLPIAILLQNLGYLATAVFFLLSGYGFTFSLKKSEPIKAQYAVRQLLKLYKPFLFIWMLDVLVNMLYLKQASCDELMTNVLTLSLTGGGSFWFLKEIVIIYILVLVVYTVFKRDSIRLEVIGGSVLLFIILGGIYDIGNQWLNSIICFPIGMICFHQKQKLNKLTIKIDILLILIFIVSFTSIYLVGALLKEPVNPQHLQLLCQIICATVFSILCVRLVSIANVKTEILRYLGSNSLSIYLYHVYFLSLYLFLSSIFIYIVAVFFSSFMLLVIFDKIAPASKKV